MCAYSVFSELGPCDLNLRRDLFNDFNDKLLGLIFCILKRVAIFVIRDFQIT